MTFAERALIRHVAGLWHLLRGTLMVSVAFVGWLDGLPKMPSSGLYTWTAVVPPAVWGVLHITAAALLLIRPPASRRVRFRACEWGSWLGTGIWLLLFGAYLASAPFQPAWTAALAGASLSYLACARPHHSPA